MDRIRNILQRNLQSGEETATQTDPTFLPDCDVRELGPTDDVSQDSVESDSVKPSTSRQVSLHGLRCGAGTPGELWESSSAGDTKPFTPMGLRKTLSHKEYLTMLSAPRYNYVRAIVNEYEPILQDKYNRRLKEILAQHRGSGSNLDLTRRHGRVTSTPIHPSSIRRSHAPMVSKSTSNRRSIPTGKSAEEKAKIAREEEKCEVIKHVWTEEASQEHGAEPKVATEEVPAKNTWRGCLANMMSILGPLNQTTPDKVDKKLTEVSEEIALQEKNLKTHLAQMLQNVTSLTVPDDSPPATHVKLERQDVNFKSEVCESSKTENKTNISNSAEQRESAIPGNKQKDIGKSAPKHQEPSPTRTQVKNTKPVQESTSVKTNSRSKERSTAGEKNSKLCPKANRTDGKAPVVEVKEESTMEGNCSKVQHIQDTVMPQPVNIINVHRALDKPVNNNQEKEKCVEAQQPHELVPTEATNNIPKAEQKSIPVDTSPNSKPDAGPTTQDHSCFICESASEDEEKSTQHSKLKIHHLRSSLTISKTIAQAGARNININLQKGTQGLILKENSSVNAITVAKLETGSTPVILQGEDGAFYLQLKPNFIKVNEEDENYCSDMYSDDDSVDTFVSAMEIPLGSALTSLSASSKQFTVKSQLEIPEEDQENVYAQLKVESDVMEKVNISTGNYDMAAPTDNRHILYLEALEKENNAKKSKNENNKDVMSVKIPSNELGQRGKYSTNHDKSVGNDDHKISSTSSVSAQMKEARVKKNTEKKSQLKYALESDDKISIPGNTVEAEVKEKDKKIVENQKLDCGNKPSSESKPNKSTISATVERRMVGSTHVHEEYHETGEALQIDNVKTIRKRFSEESVSCEKGNKTIVDNKAGKCSDPGLKREGNIYKANQFTSCIGVLNSDATCDKNTESVKTSHEEKTNYVQVLQDKRIGVEEVKIHAMNPVVTSFNSNNTERMGVSGDINSGDPVVNRENESIVIKNSTTGKENTSYIPQDSDEKLICSNYRAQSVQSQEYQSAEEEISSEEVFQSANASSISMPTNHVVQSKYEEKARNKIIVKISGNNASRDGVRDQVGCGTLDLDRKLNTKDERSLPPKLSSYEIVLHVTPGWDRNTPDANGIEVQVHRKKEDTIIQKVKAEGKEIESEGLSIEEEAIADDHLDSSRRTQQELPEAERKQKLNSKRMRSPSAPVMRKSTIGTTNYEKEHQDLFVKQASSTPFRPSNNIIYEENVNNMAKDDISKGDYENQSNKSDASIEMSYPAEKSETVTGRKDESNSIVSEKEIGLTSSGTVDSIKVDTRIEVPQDVQKENPVEGCSPNYESENGIGTKGDKTGNTASEGNAEASNSQCCGKSTPTSVTKKHNKDNKAVEEEKTYDPVTTFYELLDEIRTKDNNVKKGVRRTKKAKTFDWTDETRFDDDDRKSFGSRSDESSDDELPKILEFGYSQAKAIHGILKESENKIKKQIASRIASKLIEEGKLPEPKAVTKDVRKIVKTVAEKATKQVRGRVGTATMHLKSLPSVMEACESDPSIPRAVSRKEAKSIENSVHDELVGSKLTERAKAPFKKANRAFENTVDNLVQEMNITENEIIGFKSRLGNTLYRLRSELDNTISKDEGGAKNVTTPNIDSSQLKEKIDGLMECVNKLENEEGKTEDGPPAVKEEKKQEGDYYVSDLRKQLKDVEHRLSRATKGTSPSRKDNSSSEEA